MRQEVRFGGNIRTEYDEASGRTTLHSGEIIQSVMAVPYDYADRRIWTINIVNTLMNLGCRTNRLTSSLDSFDKGEYDKAVEQKNLAKQYRRSIYIQTIITIEGKELRLKQQYFFVSASLQAAVAKYKKNHDDIHKTLREDDNPDERHSSNSICSRTDENLNG